MIIVAGPSIRRPARSPRWWVMGFARVDLRWRSLMPIRPKSQWTATTPLSSVVLSTSGNRMKDAPQHPADSGFLTTSKQQFSTP